MGPSDRELVARVVVDDDRHAFATLVRRHHGAVRAFARRLDNNSADDTAQTAFVLAWKHLHTWRGEGELKSWLFKLTYRAFLTDARRAHRRRETSDDDVDLGSTAAPDVAERRDVAQALAKLRDEERAALALCFQEGLTHDEAARVLDMPLGTLKSHVARGKEKLRTMLGAYAPDGTEAA